MAWFLRDSGVLMVGFSVMHWACLLFLFWCSYFSFHMVLKDTWGIILKMYFVINIARWRQRKRDSRIQNIYCTFVCSIYIILSDDEISRAYLCVTLHYSPYNHVLIIMKISPYQLQVYWKNPSCVGTWTNSDRIWRLKVRGVLEKLY